MQVEYKKNMLIHQQAQFQSMKNKTDKKPENKEIFKKTNEINVDDHYKTNINKHN